MAKDLKRNQAILESTARACLRVHPQAWRYPGMIEKYWEHKSFLPTSRQIIRAALPQPICPAIRQTIQSWNDDSDYSPWTGNFWYGLQLSSAVVMHRRHFYIKNNRPHLVEDITNWPMTGWLGKPDNWGRHYLKQSWIGSLPVLDINGVEVLAGLMAGAKTVFSGQGKTFLAVPRTPAVFRFLDQWGIYTNHGTPKEFWLSPFWAALTASRMPMASAARPFTIKHPGDCPLLSLAYYEVLYSGEPGLHPPEAWALPYACSVATRKRRKWTKKSLHLAAISLGVAHVPNCMRVLLDEWRRSRKELKLYNPDG